MSTKGMRWADPADEPYRGGQGSLEQIVAARASEAWIDMAWALVKRAVSEGNYAATKGLLRKLYQERVEESLLEATARRLFREAGKTWE